MNLPILAKRLAFYTKYLNLSSKCSELRFKTFQREIKFKMFNFNFERIGQIRQEN